MKAAADNHLLDRMGRALLSPYFRLMHGLKWHGVENVPRVGPAILAANHQCFYDPILIGLAVRRRIVYLAWDYYCNLPVLGPLMRLCEVIPVNLDRPSPAAISAMLRALRQGRLCGMFPEAGRTTDGLIGEPMAGVAMLALRSGAPLIPVTIVGGYRAWPRAQLLPTPAPISLYFGTPFVVDRARRSHVGTAADYRKKVTFELMLRIAEGFAELGRSDLTRQSRDRLLTLFKK